MLKLALISAVVALTSSAAFADYTVYQGRSGKVLGTCSTKSDCRVIARAHPGHGESIVNNKNGHEVNKPGRSGRAHAQHKR